MQDKYDLDYFLLLLIMFDSVFFNLRNSVCTIIKAVNKFFKPTITESFISVLMMLISYYYLTLGYNYLSFFVINLISTFISFIVFSYFSIKFYNKLK